MPLLSVKTPKRGNTIAKLHRMIRITVLASMGFAGFFNTFFLFCLQGDSMNNTIIRSAAENSRFHAALVDQLFHRLVIKCPTMLFFFPRIASIGEIFKNHPNSNIKTCGMYNRFEKIWDYLDILEDALLRVVIKIKENTDATYNSELDNIIKIYLDSVLPVIYEYRPKIKKFHDENPEWKEIVVNPYLPLQLKNYQNYIRSYYLEYQYYPKFAKLIYDCLSLPPEWSPLIKRFPLDTYKENHDDVMVPLHLSHKTLILSEETILKSIKTDVDNADCLVLIVLIGSIVHSICTLRACPCLGQNNSSRGFF